ncbi:PH domain-containing protein [uncultured Psychroserpens sp.]|uniref:PH domain-containing protein n=1 Tax=uncultured Psychroserpens sp. TaxID=255436 RepID=UPI0026392D44|nr:PH domain-containing protein [uncultured Psychroserpens sp.]
MFTNHQIQIQSLPKVDDINFTNVEKSYFSIILFNLIITYGLIASVFTVFKVFSNREGFQELYWWLIVVLVFLFLIQVIVYKVGFSKRKYAMREKDISYSEGLITTSTTTLPFNRIQHIEIQRSFLSRKLNLSTLKIYSAGESGGDLSIKGLPKETAENMNAFLTNIINERL